MSHLSPRRPVNLFVLPSLVLAMGCGPKAEIQSYTVAKEAQPAAAPAATNAVLNDSNESVEATDRMLTAILPSGRQAWFLKVVGPSATVDAHTKEIIDFFGSVRLSDSGRPQWDLPSGWKEDPGAAMRAATIWVPTEGKPLEMSVTGLPWTGTQEELLANVNRWRGQLQLPEIGSDELGEFTREMAAGDATIVVVDLQGRFQGGMLGPFAGGTVGAASRAAQDSGTDLPAGHPPIDGSGPPPGSGPTTSSAPAAGAPMFDVPPSWEQLPAGGMRKAAFSVADEGEQALVTVIDFAADAGPMISDPLQNVNRWRREIGLSEIEKGALAEAVESIEIDGQKASYVRLIPDPSKPEESQAAEAILAAMVAGGDRIWFIKMKGARDVIAAQEDEFKAFLKSMQAPGDKGANDGN